MTERVGNGAGFEKVIHITTSEEKEAKATVGALHHVTSTVAGCTFYAVSC